ncbi:hypothetical protein PAMC26510_24375 [Caballeronia sordidicola]|uniref:Uncharacterized protein n=1 Tax=Caballeronia sordidicola TaxID=196367 RepID=A0A242MJ58_CABSO|nr:hypothetical protein PAMC26510_24375 [Caballeronia sordidicola]
MPRARQQPRDQPPAQPAADDGKVGLGRHERIGPHNSIHDDDASSANAAERTGAHEAQGSRCREKCPFRALTERAAHQTCSGTKPRRECSRRARNADCGPARTGRNRKPHAGFRKLPSPVLPGSGAKGLSQPRRAFLHFFKPGDACRSTPVSSTFIKT